MVFESLGAFIVAFMQMIVLIPLCIYCSAQVKLFDEQDRHRKTHPAEISRLGGMAFAVALLINIIILARHENFSFIYSMIPLLAVGVKDDLFGAARPGVKLIAQTLAFLLLFRTMETGVQGFPAVALILLSLFFVNAFNLIDGSDGLAASLGLIHHAFFSMLFVLGNFPFFAIVSFSMMGIQMGFLMFNRPPAWIFMGDTGSMLIGFLTTAFLFKLLGEKAAWPILYTHFKDLPSMVFALLSLPFLDACRVLLIRASKGKPLFAGDRTHIHHKLKDLGFDDGEILLTLCTAQLVFLSLAFLLQGIGTLNVIIIIIGSCVLFNAGATVMMARALARAGRRQAFCQ